MNIFRHKLVCAYDVNISPLPLEHPYHEQESEQNINTLFRFNSRKSLNFFDNVEDTEMEYFDDSHFHEVLSPKKAKILTFLQKDPYHLSAVCSFCGFDEIVL